MTLIGQNGTPLKAKEGKDIQKINSLVALDKTSIVMNSILYIL
jgi:hypothetical protein